MQDRRPQQGKADQSAQEGSESGSLSRDIELVGKSDREAFRRVYAQSANRLFAICVGVTRNHAAAEDVLQETYLKIWDRAAGYDPERNRPLAWLGAIARNTAIDWYRSHTRHRHVGEEHLDSHESEAIAADERMIAMNQESEAWMAVGELDKESEIELRSIFFLGLTYPQAAERLGLPVATFKSRVRRTVLKIRRLLSDG